MLTCREVTERATDFREGRMAFPAAAAFRMHLLLCGICRRYLRQLAITVEVLRCLPREPAPDEVKRDLLRRFSGLTSHAK